MTKEEIRKRVLEKLPEGIEENLPAFYNELINESIESVLDGTTRLGDKIAESLEEAVTCATYGIYIGMKSWDVMKKSMEASFPDAEVTINYRGTTHKISKNNQ